MNYIVSITSQGQVSIPTKVRKSLGITKMQKAELSVSDGGIFIEPIPDFFSLRGSIKTNKKISPRKIREDFGKYLAEEAVKGLK